MHTPFKATDKDVTASPRTIAIAIIAATIVLGNVASAVAQIAA